MASPPLLNIPSIVHLLHSSVLSGLTLCWPKPPWSYLSHWNSDKNFATLLLNLFTILCQITRFLAFPANSQLKYFEYQFGGGTGFLMYVKLLFS